MKGWKYRQKGPQQAVGADSWQKEATSVELFVMLTNSEIAVTKKGGIDNDS